MDDHSPVATFPAMPDATAPASRQPNARPIAASLALGAAIAIAPSLLAFRMPAETLANAEAHAHPLLALGG